MKIIASILSVLFLSAASLGSPAKKPATVLKSAALPRYVGAALGVGHLQNSSDPKFREVAAIEYSGATPENEMKW